MNDFTKKERQRKRKLIIAIALLIIGTVVAGARYYQFVSKTIYDESVSHLTELFHQSNKLVNELVQNNYSQLHMCSEYLKDAPNDTEIKEYGEKIQKDIGYSNFFFISAEGKYKTLKGKTGYLGLETKLDNLKYKGGSYITMAMLPGKPQMLMLICPTENGRYDSFSYNAIAIGYYNEDIVKLLDSSAFDGKASGYVILSDGRIVIDNSVDTGEKKYNFLAFLREDSDLSEKRIKLFHKDIKNAQSGAMLLEIDGEKNYLVYESTGLQNLTIVGTVPANVVNTGMKQLQLSTSIIVGAVLFCITAVIIMLLLRRSKVSLRKKDREILYREELFQKLSMNVDDVFLMLDTKTSKPDYVSPNIDRLLGITAQQVMENVLVLGNTHSKDTDQAKIDYLEGLKVGEQREWDFDYIHQKSCEHRWFHVITMCSDIEGEEKYIIVMSDRTADKRVNEALSEAVSAAETASKAKSTFLSNMSHDIRTPMNAIIGFTTLAVGHIDDKAKVQDYLGKILSSGNHLLSLINDILDMSRIESGKIHLEDNEVNLSDLLHDLKTIISGQIHAKQLELFMDATDVTNEDVYCDKTRLNQVLLNLLSNAVKFTPAGGTVSVRFRQLPGTHKERATYEVRVKDSGIGMSKEFASKIFDPFERERSSTVSKIQGTGLGMAITKNIIDMMGGTIELLTEPGKGSEFIIRLDLRVQNECRRDEKIVELEGLKALVVDDDFYTCDSVTKMLIKVGMRSEWTLSGKEAVLRARQSMEVGDAFRAYIIDWRLPDMNGLEVTRQIRSLGDDTPIIILTAYDWADIEDEAKAAGVTAFCSKPMFMSDLRETLMSAIGEAEASATEKQTSRDNLALKDKHVLLVEDNELNREIAYEILNIYGMKVDTACNGQEAVEKVKASGEAAPSGDPVQTGEAASAYDLVLMDVQMPIMNGYDATEAIRSLPNPALKNIPILAMTANAFDEDRKKALDCGMNGFLSKPIVIDELVHMIKEIL